jgi:hypothetical protein
MSRAVVAAECCGISYDKQHTWEVYTAIRRSPSRGRSHVNSMPAGVMSLEVCSWSVQTVAPKCGILGRHSTEVQQMKDIACDIRRKDRRFDPLHVVLPSVTGETSGYHLVGYQCGGGRCDLRRARACTRGMPARRAPPPGPGERVAALGTHSTSFRQSTIRNRRQNEDPTQWK